MFCGYPLCLDASFIYNGIGLYIVCFCNKAIYNPSDKNVKTMGGLDYFHRTSLGCRLR